MEKHRQIKTYWIKIEIAGDLTLIRNLVAEYCYVVGQCARVTPCEYIYTGGSESGASITLINYPKYPDTEVHLREIAFNLALMLKRRLFQRSVLIMTPEETLHITDEEEEGDENN